MFLSILSKTAVTGAFIITGYPRNMRDVVEYMARVRVLPICFLKIITIYNLNIHLPIIFRLKVQRVDGVVLLDWSDRSLERQIQLGQKTGIINNTRKAKVTHLKVKFTFCVYFGQFCRGHRY